MGTGGDFEDADCRKMLELSSRRLHEDWPMESFEIDGLTLGMRVKSWLRRSGGRYISGGLNREMVGKAEARWAANPYWVPRNFVSSKLTFHIALAEQRLVGLKIP